MRKEIRVPTERGVLLDGVLFHKTHTDTVLIAITGIHGNFYSNPFYYNIGDTLNDNGFDFIYAQMKNLRKRLAEAQADIEIKTVHGYGYKLERQ